MLLAYFYVFLIGLFASFLIIFAATSLMETVLRKKCAFGASDWLLVLGLALCFTYYIPRDLERISNAPHHVVVTIAQHVSADFWTTNNIYVVYRSERRLTPAGFEYYPVRITNEYWHKWNFITP
jgi:hypothetical protein